MNRVKNILIIMLFVLVCFVLQTTLFDALSFSGIKPNLMLIITCSFSLLLTERKGMVLGLCCGLLVDIMFGPLLGFYGLIYAVIGFLCGKLERIIYADDYKLPLLIIACSDLVFGFYSFVFLFLLRGRLILKFFAVHYIFPELVYTVLISLFLYPFILFIYNRFMKEKRESETKLV